MKTKEKRKPTQPQPAGTLPPIPTDTPEGIRLHAIAATIRAIDDHKGGYGLEIDHDVRVAVARALDMPVLFIAATCDEEMADNLITDEQVAAYVVWRRQLAAGKAVAC